MIVVGCNCCRKCVIRPEDEHVLCVISTKPSCRDFSVIIISSLTSILYVLYSEYKGD
jgi:hypothetical protein